MSRTYEVRYQVGTYAGTVHVHADEDADHDHIVALAKREWKRRGGGYPGGPCYESWKVVPS